LIFQLPEIGELQFGHVDRGQHAAQPKVERLSVEAVHDLVVRTLAVGERRSHHAGEQVAEIEPEVPRMRFGRVAVAVLHVLHRAMLARVWHDHANLLREEMFANLHSVFGVHDEQTQTGKLDSQVEPFFARFKRFGHSSLHS